MKHSGTSHAASSCTPSRLDRLLYAELPAAEAEALRAHVQRCGACAHELAWQRQGVTHRRPPTCPASCSRSCSRAR